MIAALLAVHALAQRGLVVIGRAEFAPALASFVEHRAQSMPARFVALEDVLARADGVDAAEKVKRFLYDDMRGHDTGYALLVGDADVFPVRYMMLDRVDKPSFDVAFYPSDLYYADLARADGTFDDWNAEREGIHAHYYGEVHGEHHKTAPINFDRIDYVPDIAVGRWPVSNAAEIENVVAKTLAFEVASERAPRAAFVVAGGWVDARPAYDALSKTLPATWTSEALYYDTALAPNIERVVERIARGTTLVVHGGHGSPDGWDGCLSIAALARVENARSPSILVSAGCSTATMAALPPYEPYVDALGAEHPGTVRGEVFACEPPPPACFQPGAYNATSLGEQSLRRSKSGAVAYFGCDTGSQPCALTLVGGFVESMKSARRLGDAWTGAVALYVEREHLRELTPTDDWYPASIYFQGQKFLLFGDPSLPLPAARVGESAR